MNQHPYHNDVAKARKDIKQMSPAMDEEFERTLRREAVMGTDRKSHDPVYKSQQKNK